MKYRAVWKPGGHPRRGGGSMPAMFQHSEHPWMLADIDRMVTLPDGSTAILEIKTTNYNARDKWEYDGKPIVPVYYESQGRHYMAVMNLNRVYYCCLYGNNEDEVIIRSIDRDMTYERELIALEENFWVNHIQAKVPPPYIEDDGELILRSITTTRAAVRTAVVRSPTSR